MPGTRCDSVDIVDIKRFRGLGCIRYFDASTPGANIIGRFRVASTNSKRATISGEMSCLKDEANIRYMKGGEWQELGAQCYMKVIELVPELKN